MPGLALVRKKLIEGGPEPIEEQAATRIAAQAMARPGRTGTRMGSSWSRDIRLAPPGPSFKGTFTGVTPADPGAWPMPTAAPPCPADNGGMQTNYSDKEPSRAEVDGWAGPAVVEFGTPWCGYCRAIQGPLASALARHPGVRHIRVEDGRGRPLGRSYRVKLWPTLVFLRDGREVARLVRPAAAAIDQALAGLA